MVNGAGPMAKEMSEAVIRSDDFELLPFAFTGHNTSSDYDISGTTIHPIQPNERLSFLETTILPDSFISVDFTSPEAVNSNCDFYCENEMPFVMGTTGGDRGALEKRIASSKTVAVVATNMAKQIVALQSVIKKFADEYKGLWKKGESGLYIRESHQGVDVINDFKGKKDTSGTAKSMVEYFNTMGIPFDVRDIAKIRDMEDQKLLGIPGWALKGHGWHRYKLHSFIPENQSLIRKLSRRVSEFMQNDSVFESYENGNVSVKTSYKSVGGDIVVLQDNKIMFRRESESSLSVYDSLRISPEKNVMFRVEERFGELKIDHNVNGRSIYSGGGLDGMRYLKGKVESGINGKMYSMINVIKNK